MAKKAKKAPPTKKAAPKKTAVKKGATAVKKIAAKKTTAAKPAKRVAPRKPPPATNKKAGKGISRRAMEMDAVADSVESITGTVTICGQRVCLDGTPMICGSECLTSNFDDAFNSYGCKAGKRITVSAEPDTCQGVDVLRVPLGPC